MLLVLMLLLSACGDKNNGKGENTSSSEEKIDNKSTSGDISEDGLMAMKASPEEDFDHLGNKDTGLTIIAYKGSDKAVYVPKEINGIRVVQIGKSIFSNDGKGVKAIRLGKNVKTVQENAFANNNDIELVIAEGLETIEAAGFLNTPNLKKIVLIEGLKSIGSSALDATGLKEIRIPKSVKKIEVGALGVYKEGIKIIVSKGFPLAGELRDYDKGFGYEVVEE